MTTAVRPSVNRVWSMEAPPEWEARLRELSPISETVPWLATRWYPLKKSPVGRWVISECVPEAIIPENDRDIVTLLQGPKPSLLPPQLRAVVTTMVNDYQWAMYRDHRVWARELWIVQGETGGHATHFTPTEQKLLRLFGLPTDPPALGALPYAPLDGRVIGRLTERNRLRKLRGNLDALRRTGTAEAMKAEEDEAERAYRKRFVAYVEETSRSRADLLAWFSSKGDNRDVLPSATAAEVNAASRLKDEYIETGILPSA